MDKELETVFLAGIKAMEEQSRGFQDAMQEQTAALREAVGLCRDLGARLNDLSERIAVLEARLEQKE